MKLISIGTFAREVGLTPTTLRRMHKTGDLVPTYVSKGGTRYYSAEQLKKFSHQESQSNLVIGYCRVSTSAQKDDLEKQVENVKAYMYAKGYEFEIIRDIGSGINYKKKGLRALIEKISNQEVSKVVIIYKDRLVRFGFELIEYLCIQIITVFANRLYGQRSKKTKKLIEEVKQNASREEDPASADA